MTAQVNREHRTIMSEFSSFDNIRNDGLAKTSLNVLNQKQTHKTQIQRQLQQFNKFNLRQQQQNQGTHDKQGYQGLEPPISSIRTTGSINSFNSFNSISSHSDSHLPLNQGPFLQGNHWNLSSHDLKLNNNNRASGSLSYNDEYTSVSDYHEDLLAERIKELELENTRLKAGVSSDNISTVELSEIQEIQFMNDTLLKENQDLRLELKKLKSSPTQTLNPNVQPTLAPPPAPPPAPQIPLNSEKELKTFKELEELKAKNESLELNYEGLTQEVSRLTLVNKIALDSKDKAIKTLKEELNQLEDHIISLEEELESKPEILPTPPTPLLLSSPRIGQNAENLAYNEEVIQHLLITIRQLRSDQNLLKSESSLLFNTISRQKRMIKRMSETRNDNAKIRKGFKVLHEVETKI